MLTVIWLLIYIVLFVIVAYGLLWVCERFAMPQPVRWICGAVLLIVLLLFIAGQLGVTGGTLPLLRRP